MNPSKRLLPALLALAACWANAAAGAPITITSNHAYIELKGSTGNGSAHFFGTSIPTSHLLDVTAGDYYSRTQIDYTESGGNVSLLNTFNQKRSGNLDSFSYGIQNFLYFTATSNASYALSGAYSVVDVSTAGYLDFESFLYDLTTSTYLVNSYQYSNHTLNESFVLGGQDGDDGNGNVFQGSLTGSLIAGHQYMWSYDAITYAFPDSDGGASATGFVRLDIGGGANSPGPGGPGGGGSSVPDDGTTLALLGLGAFALAACRRQVASLG